MGTFGNTFGLIQNRGFSNSNSLPSYSTVSVWLDGTIIDVSGSKYFVNKKGGANVLINGYDFPSNWEKGFPYKSAATIDIFGMTGVPVVSLFQNIDYGNQYFTRHVAQVVDVNGVETSEAYVADIVAYSSPLTGDDLVEANTYYGVPAEDVTAIWVSPTGNDTTGNGAKATPYATVDKAVTIVQNGRLIYVKSSSPLTLVAGRISDYYNNNVLFIGHCKAITTGTSYSIFTQGPELIRWERLVLEQSTADRNIVNGNGSVLLAFANNHVTTNAGRSFTGSWQKILNNIFKGTMSNVQPVLSSNSLIDREFKNNLFLSENQPSDISCLTNAGNVIIYNNKFKGKPRTDTGLNIRITATNGSIKIFGNWFENLGSYFNNIDFQGLVTSASATIEIAYNRFLDHYNIYKLIDLPNHQLHTPSVHDNVYIADNPLTNTRFIGFHASNMDLKRNILYNAVAQVTADDIDNEILNNEVGAVTLINTLEDNKVTVNRNGEFHIVIGCPTTNNGDNKVTILVQRNVIRGYGYFNAGQGAARGIYIGHQRNAVLKHNYLYGLGYGIAIDANNYANTSGGVTYNLIEKFLYGIYNNGQDDCRITNNTLVSAVADAYGIFLNTGTAGGVIKNNIIILSGTGTVRPVRLADASVDVVDYNIYYTISGTLRFRIGITDYTFAEWQALGYDTHSVVLTTEQYDTLMNADYTPKAGSLAIGFGEDLGVGLNTGLDVSTVWGGDSVLPSVITKQQPSLWDVGAYIS